MSEELLPRPQAPMVDRAGQPTPEWYDYLRELAVSGGSASTAILEAQIQALQEQIDALTLGTLTGPASVEVFGSLADGAVVQLDGDEAAPDPFHYYGTADAARGFFALSDGFTAGQGVALSVAAGVTEIACDLEWGEVGGTLSAQTDLQSALDAKSPLANPAFTGAVGLPSYTVATLPSASPAGRLIYVTDESGGAVPAFSDATNWRRVTDRAVVT